MKKKDIWQKFYDQKWLKVYSSFFSDRQTINDVDLIVNLASLNKKDSILDLCCGYGRHTIVLAKRGYRVVGFDYSQPFLQQARQEAADLKLKIDFFKKNIADFDEEEKFDVILMIYPAIFYFSKAKMINIFKKVKKSLKPGGRLLIKTVSAEKYKDKFIKEGQVCPVEHFYKIEQNFEFEKIKVFQSRILDIKAQQEKIKLLLSAKKKKKEVRNFIFNFYNKDQLNVILSDIGFTMGENIVLKDGDLPTIMFLFRKNNHLQNIFKLPQIINDIQSIRENRWMIPSYNREAVLLSMARSKNHVAQEKGLELLEKSWVVKPKDSLKKAQIIDIEDEFKEFSFRQKKLIFKSFFALELIKGCTGNCYFCPLGRQGKIENLFSFKSLKKFYQKYKCDIGLNFPKKLFEELKRDLFRRFPGKYRYLHLSPPQNKETLAYWDSDPFLYHDGRKTFFDVYQLVAGSPQSRFSPYISTSIAPDSQKLFVEFFEKIAINYFQKKIKLPTVRISLAKHNVQRVETTLKFLYYYLISKDFTFEQVHLLFENSFIFHIRDEQSLFKVGPLIKIGDGFRDIFSPLCEDGFIISPQNSRLQFMVSASQFCPSGGLNIFIKEKDFIMNLIKQSSLFNYAFHDQNKEYLDDPQKHLAHLRQLILQKKIFLPLPEKLNGDLFLGKENSSEIERIIFVLSRYSLSLRHFLSYSGNLSSSWISIDLKNSYFQIAGREFEAHSQLLKKYLKKAEKELSRMKKIARNKKKVKELRYLYQLADFHLKITDLAMNFVITDKNLDLTIVIINFLLKISSKEAKKTGKILRNLSSLINTGNEEQELIMALILVLPQIATEKIVNLGEIISNVKELFSEKFIKDNFNCRDMEEFSYQPYEFLITSQKVESILRRRIIKHLEVKNNKELVRYEKDLKDLLLLFSMRING